MSASAIFDAIAADDSDQCKQTIAADPGCLDSVDGTGVTPLIRAGLDGKRQAATAILEARSESLVEIAAIGDNDRTAAYLDENPDAVHAKTVDGYTPLHVASLFGHDRVVDVLLEYGADIDAEVEGSQYQAIHCATISGAQPTLDVLLARGADPDSQSANGYTPLMIAAERGLERPLMTLVHYNCDVDLESDDGKTAREIAAAGGHARLVELIPG